MGFAGALLCAFAALGAGRRLNPAQPAAIQFLLGAAALSVAFCVAGLAGAFHAWVLVGIALLSATQFRPSQLAFRLDWRTALLFAPLAVVYLIWASAPEISPDGTAYHWNLPQKYLRAGRITFEPGSIYAQFPQAMEMLYGLGLVFSTRSPALIHLGFLAALTALVARRGGTPAALLLFAAPVVGIDAASAYNDVALAAVCFAVFVLAEEYREKPARATLASAALLAGFAMSLKYTGALAVVYLAMAVRVGWPGWWLAVAAIPVAPWLAKNWWLTGNPVSPFFNAWFPNPVYDAPLESAYLASLRWPAAGIPWTEVIQETCLRGEKLRGLLGPAFLLAPLGLAAGGRLAWAGALFALPFALNAGTRFLIPALPFWSLLLARVLGRWPKALGALAAVQILAAWPGVMELYAPKHAWRIREIPWRAALGLEAERAYVARWWPEAALAPALDRVSGRVLALKPFPEAYTRADIWVANHSRPAADAARVVNSAVDPGQRPGTRYRYWFPARVTDRIRLVQTGGSAFDLSEVRLYHLLTEVPVVRASGWPNGFSAQSGVDGRRFTRWRSGAEGGRSAAVFEVRLAGRRPVSRLEFDLDNLQRDWPEARVETWSGSAWQVAGIHREVVKGVEEGYNVRDEAVRALKSLGIQYLLIHSGAAAHHGGFGEAVTGAGGAVLIHLP